jgi:sugar/nucleoside kinase (ribokinase family)
MKLAVVGDFGVDFYQNLNLLKPGGIAFNFAYNLKKSGAEKVSLVSILGKDAYSKKLLSVLKETKIDGKNIQLISGAPPKQNIFLKNGERKFTGYEAGVLKRWKLRKTDLDFIKRQDAVFVPLSDGMEQIYNAVKKLPDVIKIIDFSQDYEFADFDKKNNVITKNSKYFDIIFVGGKKKHLPMIKKLAEKYPEKVFALTLGKEGSIAYHMNTKFVQPAKRVKIVDTTGAGDAFQASFLASWLKTKDIKKSLKAGSASAATIIKLVGSTSLKLK